VKECSFLLIYYLLLLQFDFFFFVLAVRTAFSAFATSFSAALFALSQQTACVLSGLIRLLSLIWLLIWLHSSLFYKVMLLLLPSSTFLRFSASFLVTAAALVGSTSALSAL
jgi:hypothetical protein